MKIMFPPTGFQYLANEIQLEGKKSLLTSVHTLSPQEPLQLCSHGSDGHIQGSWHSGYVWTWNQPFIGQFWSTGIQNGKTENVQPHLTEHPLSSWVVSQLGFPTANRPHRSQHRRSITGLCPPVEGQVQQGFALGLLCGMGDKVDSSQRKGDFEQNGGPEHGLWSKTSFKSSSTFY